MLNPDDVEKALALQAKTYACSSGPATPVRKRTLTFSAAHQYATASESLHDWLVTYIRDRSPASGARKHMTHWNWSSSDRVPSEDQLESLIESKKHGRSRCNRNLWCRSTFDAATALPRPRRTSSGSRQLALSGSLA
jgi:hypothetical protein